MDTEHRGRDEWPERPSARFLIYKILRRESLCDGPHICPKAAELDGWTERCETCGIVQLDRAMNSATGQMVARAVEIDNDIEFHIPPNLDEIPARVYSLVKLIRSEKDRYQRQLDDAARNQQ